MLSTTEKILSGAVAVLVIILIILVYYFANRRTYCSACPACACMCPKPLIQPVYLKSVKTGKYLNRDLSIVANKSDATPFLLDSNDKNSGQVYPLFNGQLLQYTLSPANTLIGVLNVFGYDTQLYIVSGDKMTISVNQYYISQALTNPEFQITFEKA